VFDPEDKKIKRNRDSRVKKYYNCLFWDIIDSQNMKGILIEVNRIKEECENDNRQKDYKKQDWTIRTGKITLHCLPRPTRYLAILVTASTNLNNCMRRVENKRFRR